MFAALANTANWTINDLGVLEIAALAWAFAAVDH